ncbi:MAG: sugar phosphate nucleotidyltransferase [Verrucomicrobia bacterium]|nr:sugar phosphate nucleotidyltransferase [Verrucomicrobiota bacterium]
MKLLILAAGYATRLYPLTLNKAKPLLDVAGKPMIEHLLDKFVGKPGLDEIYVVTNNKFAADFAQWGRDYTSRHPGASITAINDHTTSNADKLGAIGDINLVINQSKLDDDLIVVAGDNLFEEDADGFLGAAHRNAAEDHPTIVTYDVGDIEEVRKKYNNLQLASDGHVAFFSEKDPNASSTVTAICLYYFPRNTVKLVARYLAEGNNPDQPGRYIGWLYKQTPVFTYQIRGRWLDIGSKETLEQANREFARK